jgi:hypothetical protein
VLIGVARVENIALGFQCETFGGWRLLRAARRNVRSFRFDVRATRQ